MTRKQALQRAIEIVNKARIKSAERDEIIAGLNLCYEELPFAQWSKEAIIDTCNQFVIDNQRDIYTSDFMNAGMPSHPTIKNRYGMTAKEFRDKYYPLKINITPKSRYRNKTSDEWKSIFISEYNRIQPSCQAEYNEKRDKNHPSWITVAKMLNVNTWSGLLKVCNLTKHRITKMNIKRTYKL